MERVKQIMEHPLYCKNQQRIDELEKDRIFCKHSINHSLDVARILYILVLERKADILKDVVYATALLHDIGRAVQYDAGKPHHEAGIEIAEGILKDCGYTKEEIEKITEAISAHKCGVMNFDGDQNNSLTELLYHADKLSRNCFDCKAQEECYWEQSKRNAYVKY